MPFVPGEAPRLIEYVEQPSAASLRPGQTLEIARRAEGDVEWHVIEDEPPAPERVDVPEIPLQGHETAESAEAHEQRLYSELHPDPKGHLGRLIAAFALPGETKTVDRNGLVLSVQRPDDGSDQALIWVNGKGWSYNAAAENYFAQFTNADPRAGAELNHQALSLVLTLMKVALGKEASQCGIEEPEPPAEDTEPTPVPLLDDTLREMPAR